MFNIFKDNKIPEYEGPNFDTVEEPFYVSGCDPVESSTINFNTLNTITKSYYSTEVRVARMLTHARTAAEKGSWWCNVPELGEGEIELLKEHGLRVFKKEVNNPECFGIGPEYITKFSINWSDKDVIPADKNLEEL